MKKTGRRALIGVDIQNDFLQGGALAVPRGNEIVSVFNVIKQYYKIVIATQDYHPKNHGSFASNHGKEVYSMTELGGLPQVLWPDHCVQQTNGANFEPHLDLHGVTIFRKGMDPEIDSYSGFFDNGYKNNTGLDRYLQEFGVTDLDIMGLATDYCVKATVLDAAKLGYSVRVIVDGCRAVNLKPTDEEQALAEMVSSGAFVINSSDII